jgi:putative alpha-1,2-mannosidase
MAIGLFSVNGGCSVEPFYEVTSPVFERIKIHLDPRYYAGEPFVIEVERAAEEDVYIQSARLNGEALERPWFYHRDLAQGGTLELVLGPEPNESWGSRPEDAPPSMSGNP